MNGQTVSALRAVTGITVSCMISPIERGMEQAKREREGIGREDSEGSGKDSEKQEHAVNGSYLT